MANDPNRDLLPVKEDCCRSRQGPTERNDHQSLTKLSRCELEDKVHRLLDEQTHLKKLANSQEEKIKRLGTKLLRLINEKKNIGKNAVHLKTTEDVQFQFLELEHENYALKDKITVLRQQLASQSRHIAIRSPVRSNHISPLMSMRHSGSNDITFENGNKVAPADVQLHEAEVHIKELSDEIKSLHNKVGYLQQDLEKNNLDNRKTKVTENIEFIRLQRTLKQQAIQIAALQAQIKNSENNQKVLKNELLKAHNENDEALHLIAVKQNEILNLCSKLEESNLNRLEEDDLKQRINDLTLERDTLKARADLLMKTIEEKQHAKPEKVKELETVTHQEKLQTKKQEHPQLVHNPESYSSSDYSCGTRNSFPIYSLGTEKSGLNPNSKDGKSSADAFLSKNDASTSPFHSKLLPENKSVQTEAIYPELINENESKISGDKTELEDMEKIKMELELQHLREMLRNQTFRCEAQQNKISRLLSELKLSENKCQNTLLKLDRRLSAFENLEARTREKEFGSPSGKSSPLRQTFVSLKGSPISRSKQTVSESSQESAQENEFVKEKVHVSSVEIVKQDKNRSNSNTDNSIEKRSYVKTPGFNSPNSGTIEKVEPKKRFVDLVFLESSEEGLVKAVLVEDLSSQKEKTESNDQEILQQKKNKPETRETKLVKSSRTQKLTPETSEVRNIPNATERKDLAGAGIKSKISMKEMPQKFVITISWLEIDTKSSLWSNPQVKLLFVDFTFLDLHGENTETPESLPKPAVPGQRCEFNFVKEIEINESRRNILQGLMNKPDLSLIIFKVVSDSEDFDQLTEFDCEDVGVAVVTVKMFLENFNEGFFTIAVRNREDTKEVIGTLCIAIEVSPGLFTPKNSV